MLYKDMSILFGISMSTISALRQDLDLPKRVRHIPDNNGIKRECLQLPFAPLQRKRKPLKLPFFDETEYAEEPKPEHKLKKPRRKLKKPTLEGAKRTRRCCPQCKSLSIDKKKSKYRCAKCRFEFRQPATTLAKDNKRPLPQFLFEIVKKTQEDT